MQTSDQTGLPPDWELRWSKTQKTAYCFNVKTRESTWEIPLQSDTDLLIPYTKQFSQQQLQLQEGSQPQSQTQSQLPQVQQPLPTLNLPQQNSLPSREQVSQLQQQQPSQQHLKPVPSSTPAEFIRCAHLLVKHSGSRNPKNAKGQPIFRTREEAWKKIVRLKEAVGNDPLKFKDLAILESDCSSASNGGDLGICQRGQMQKEFEDAAYALEEGQFSDIISSASGLHIIYRIELDPAQLARHQQHARQHVRHTSAHTFGIPVPT